MVTSCRARRLRFSFALALKLTAEWLLLVLCVCARRLSRSHRRRLFIKLLLGRYLCHARALVNGVAHSSLDFDDSHFLTFSPSS